MNINDSSQLRECTSCQLCEAICPSDAITIYNNEEGFYRPRIDPDKCIDCGKCVRVCYKFDDKIRITTDYSQKQLYASWAKDQRILDITTSGGIADILAKELIKQGYNCIGVVYNYREQRAETQIAKTIEKTDDFRGSKYIQTLSGLAFRDFHEQNSTEKFAIFGLPCQIYAIDRYLKLKKKRDKHILIDMYCHGCPSLHLWKKYLKEIKEEYDIDDIVDIKFRSKEKGWGKYTVGIHALSRHKKRIILSSPLNNSFYELFFSDMVLNKACYDCLLRGTLEYSDIRLGDFWGKSFLSNIHGVSGVTINSEIGEELFTSVKDHIICKKQLFSSFLPYQSYGKTYQVSHKVRELMLHQLTDDDIPIKQIITQYRRSLSLYSRFKLYMKHLAEGLPQQLLVILKRIIYSIK